MDDRPTGILRAAAQRTHPSQVAQPHVLARRQLHPASRLQRLRHRGLGTPASREEPRVLRQAEPSLERRTREFVPDRCVVLDRFHFEQRLAPSLAAHRLDQRRP